MVEALVALTPATRLGAYEIQGALGAGGMGEVFSRCYLPMSRRTPLTRSVDRHLCHRYRGIMRL